jgi:hypothetical protein
MVLRIGWARSHCGTTCKASVIVLLTSGSPLDKGVKRGIESQKSTNAKSGFSRTLSLGE